jgi:hypothetical protein
MTFMCLTTSSAACEAFVQDAGDTACISCVVSAENATSYGPVVQFGGGVFVLNVGGCVALADPCLTPCGEVYEAWTRCHEVACASCPLDNGLGAFEACTNIADTCSCAPLAAQVNTCLSAILDSPASKCLATTSNSFSSAGEFATSFFCGDAASP